MWKFIGFLPTCLIFVSLVSTLSHAQPTCGPKIIQLMMQDDVVLQLTKPDQIKARALVERYSQKDANHNATVQTRPADGPTNILRKLELAESRVRQTPHLIEAMKKLSENEREAFICRVLNGYSKALSAKSLFDDSSDESLKNFEELTKEAFRHLFQGDTHQNTKVLQEVLSLPGPQRRYLKNKVQQTPENFLEWMDAEPAI